MGQIGCIKGSNGAKTEKHSFGQSKLVSEVTQFGRALLGDKEESKIGIERNCWFEESFVAWMADSVLQW